MDEQLGDTLAWIRKHLPAVLDSAGAYVFCKDTCGRYLWVNKAFAEAACIGQELWIGKTESDLFGDVDRQRGDSDREVISTGRAICGMIELLPSAHSDAPRWARIDRSPCRDDRGNIIGIVAVGVDVTELKSAQDDRRELEDRLRQAEKMQALGELAGGIAHDFNNQLAGIMGYTEMIRKRVDEDERLTRYADTILKVSRRASSLVAQLLAFARKGKRRPVDVDAHELLDEVIALLERSIDQRIKIERAFCADAPAVTGDPTQLQNALLNLGINARDAMPEGGRLTFATKIVDLDEEYCRNHTYEITAGCYVQIAVSDTGVGMDAETQARIFEPFFTTKEAGKGTGMGLAAVYGAVKSHEGSINVYSETGRGTTFRVYLPVAESTGKRRSASPASEGTASGHIMVVDDDDTARATARSILSEMGYVVSTFATGEDAVACYVNVWKEIDVVVLDMTMPAMSGPDTFRAMRRVNPDIRSVLSSGHALDGQGPELLDEGIRSFVEKPFTVDELCDKVAAAKM